jgi:hypothetical protein
MAKRPVRVIATFCRRTELETAEGLVERCALNGDGTVGARFHKLSDGIAVHRFPRESAQHQEVQRAVEQIERRARHRENAPDDFSDLASNKLRVSG